MHSNPWSQRLVASCTQHIPTSSVTSFQMRQFFLLWIRFDHIIWFEAIVNLSTDLMKRVKSKVFSDSFLYSLFLFFIRFFHSIFISSGTFTSFYLYYSVVISFSYNFYFFLCYSFLRSPQFSFFRNNWTVNQLQNSGSLFQHYFKIEHLRLVVKSCANYTWFFCFYLL